MDFIHSLVHNLRTGAHQFVYHTRDEFFVARNGGCADDDEIVRRNADLAVLAHCHACQCGHGFALTAGRNEDELFRRVFINQFQINHHTGRNLQIAQFDAFAHDVNHASARHGNFTPCTDSIINNLLNPVDVGGKGRDNNAFALRCGKQLFKTCADLTLGHRKAGALCVGGIRHQSQYTLVAQFGKARQIDNAALNGGKINLKVAGMHNHAGGGVQCHAYRIRNRMIHADEFHRHTAEFHGLTGCDNVHGHTAGQAMFF